AAAWLRLDDRNLVVHRSRIHVVAEADGGGLRRAVGIERLEADDELVRRRDVPGQRPLAAVPRHARAGERLARAVLLDELRRSDERAVRLHAGEAQLGGPIA